MRPDEYEQLVGSYFTDLGYEVEITSYTNDYGLDIIAIKDEKKTAIQAKMFGDTSRKINRQMVMELHGVKDYFGCDKAIIATDGEVIANAMEVASKLDIDILHVSTDYMPKTVVEKLDGHGTFEKFWEEHIMPLEGMTLCRDNGKSNQIVKVDWAGIKRLTSNSRPQTIKIEIFKKTFMHLLEHGSITRDFINQEYPGRASSGIVLILSNTPVIERTTNPVGLSLVDFDGISL
jgi:restriction system protein